MKLRHALLLGPLLAACVINTRPHLPSTTGDASPSLVGGQDGTDTASRDGGAERADAAYDVLAVEDQGVPAAATDAGGSAFDATSAQDGGVREMDRLDPEADASADDAAATDATGDASDVWDVWDASDAWDGGEAGDR